MKIVINILFYNLLAVILFSSCNKSELKVALMFPHLESDRYVKEKQYFFEKVQELGGTPVLVSADRNDQLQIRQASELINDGVKVLVVNPLNANTAAAIVREAHDRGVVVIAYDRLIKNCDLDYFLSFDNEKVGRLMAEYVTRIKPEGNYFILGGDKADQNAIWVKKGQMDVLEPFIKSGKIKIIYNTYIEDWSGDNAQFEMSNFFKLSPEMPDVVLSSYDGMSTGAIKEFKNNNLQGKIIITGQDAELEACKNIVEGNQIMTIYKPVKALAYKAAELSIKIAKGEKISDVNSSTPNGAVDVPAVLLEPVVVDKNNIKTTVIADGFIKESDLNRK